MPRSEDIYRKFNSTLAGKSDQIYDYDPFIGPTGDFRKISGIDVAIRSIRTLLLTPLGFYPFDPEYGSLLYKKLFEPADENTIKEIEYEIRDRIAIYEDRVKVSSVNSYFMGDKKTLVVNVIILRNGITGTVSVILDPHKTMFGLEDKISEGSM